MPSRSPPKPEITPDRWSLPQAENYIRAYLRANQEIAWTNHLWIDHPERMITKPQILEALKAGRCFLKEPPSPKYGSDTWNFLAQSPDGKLKVVLGFSDEVVSDLFRYKPVFVTAVDPDKPDKPR